MVFIPGTLTAITDIATHRSPDFDALSSVAALRFYAPELRGRTVTYHDADWQGPLGSGQIALDLKGDGTDAFLKGEVSKTDGSVGSSLRMVVNLYASTRELELVQPLVTLVDTHDSYGDPFLKLYGDLVPLDERMFMTETSMLMFYRAMVSTGGHDEDVRYGNVLSIFDNMYAGYLLHRTATLTGDIDVMEGIIDCDEALAITAYWHYVPASKKSTPVYKDGRWTGRLSNGDIVVDDPKEVRNGSRLGQVMRAHAGPEEIALMESLIKLMDAYLINFQNPFAVIYKHMFGKLNWEITTFLGDTSLVAAFQALRRSVYVREVSEWQNGNKMLVSVAERILSAFRKNRVRADEAKVMMNATMAGEATQLQIYEEADQKVVVITNVNNHRISDVLFNYYDVRAVVVVDGDNLLVRRADGETLRMDSKVILQVLFDAGEINNLDPASVTEYNLEWFLHLSGFMIACGTRKRPAKQPSSVLPEHLARAVLELFVADRLAA